MQEKEYNKLFDQAFTSLSNNQKLAYALGHPLMADLRTMPQDEVKSLQALEVDEAREIIQKYEKPIPEKLAIKVKMYIDRRRKSGASEQAISKAVKKKFFITVI